MAWPKPDIPRPHHLVLAQIVAETSWLPHPETVKQFNGPVFPTIRKKQDAHIGTPVLLNDALVGMFDNNKTPTLALGWTHGMSGSTKGWTVAHIWPSSTDVTAYTHLANLALVPEALSTTTDKSGPLTSYLRWHSWKEYGWRPEGIPMPQEPANYSEVQWRYLPKIQNPRAAVETNLQASKNQVLIKLRSFMKELGFQ